MWSSVIIRVMEFECNGIRKSPGVFHTFDIFRDLLSWACRAFNLGPRETAKLAYFADGKWSDILAGWGDFILAPWYAIYQPGQEPVYMKLV